MFYPDTRRDDPYLLLTHVILLVVARVGFARNLHDKNENISWKKEKRRQRQAAIISPDDRDETTRSGGKKNIKFLQLLGCSSRYDLYISEHADTKSSISSCFRIKVIDFGVWNDRRVVFCVYKFEPHTSVAVVLFVF